MTTENTARLATKIRVLLAALMALATPMLLSACSDDAPTGSTASPTSADTGSPSAEPTVAPEEIDNPQQAAMAAFERFMHAFIEASAVPDPNYPALATAASGDALEAVTDALQVKIDRGQRSEGQPEILDLTVKDAALDADPVQVAVETCQDSTNWVIVDAASGEPVPGEEYGRRHIEALVELLDGHWYVTKLAIRDFGSCLPRSLDLRSREPPREC